MIRPCLPLALLALFALPLVGAEPAARLMPAEGVWRMRYDGKLDGLVEGKAGDDVRWALSVRNDRVSGSLADLKPGDPKDHRVAGELTAGKPALLMLRQDGPDGLVCYYTGKRADGGTFVGTWFDNRGSSGDFELRLEKK